MKEITIKIPDTKLNFIMELMNQLGIEVSQKYDIPVEHINIVKERMADSDLEPNRIEDWEVAKKKLNFDS